jgi:hypothetical protein
MKKSLRFKVPERLIVTQEYGIKHLKTSKTSIKFSKI